MINLLIMIQKNKKIVMIVPFVLVGVFLILWSVYDIFKQSIDWKYKIVMTLVVCLFSIVGILVYWLLLRPAIKRGRFA